MQRPTLIGQVLRQLQHAIEQQVSHRPTVLKRSRLLGPGIVDAWLRQGMLDRAGNAPHAGR